MPFDPSLTSEALHISPSSEVSPAENALTRDLFGSDLDKPEVIPWNDLIRDKWCDLSRKGLPIEYRDGFLRKYSPPEALSFLKAPRLNPELRSALKSISVIKRDEYCCRDQD